jgi:hypothetical protein
MKLLTTLIVFSFLGNAVQAQIHLGPVVGGQLSWVSFADKENKSLYRVKPVMGINAGVTVSFLVRKRFFLHTSVLYSTKGRNLIGKQDALLDHKIRTHYIDIPVLYAVDFKARFGAKKTFLYYLGIGPNISYWLGGKGEIYASDFNEKGYPDAREFKIAFDKNSDNIEPDEMVIEDPNRIQLGLNLGAGIVFEPSQGRKVLFTARYEFGHSFFSRTSNGLFAETYFQDPLRSRNQGVRISFAYLIDLKLQDRKKGKSTYRM